MSAALSPATIASAAVAVARAARQYLDALSDAQSESVTYEKEFCFLYCTLNARIFFELNIAPLFVLQRSPFPSASLSPSPHAQTTQNE